MNYMVQEAKSPVKISSGSVTRRDLIPVKRVNGKKFQVASDKPTVGILLIGSHKISVKC
jgi:hypothetical protein